MRDHLHRESLRAHEKEIAVDEWDRRTRQADVVIVTALRLEFDAVLKVDAGSIPGSTWELVPGPSGLPVAFRSFVVKEGRPLRVAVSTAPDMGATAAVNTLLPLVEKLAPRCIAMCGVCAGRRGKVQLGDVVAADRLYYHDAGKQLPGRVQQDLTTYKLRDDWKAALEGVDAANHLRDQGWFQARPITTEWRLYRALAALRRGLPEPWNAIDQAPGGTDEWPRIVAALRKRRFLDTSGRTLTSAGRRFVDDILFKHRNVLPDLSPTGSLHPFRLHVAPIGSGSRVIEDKRIWSFISQAMRKTLGLEMEAAALGELAHRQRQYKLDAVVMKGVMDFADHGRDDHFKDFAARASAECLLWFLRENVPTELIAGFDDLLPPGILRLPSGTVAPSLLLNARYAVVPWHEAGRSQILADLDTWADDTSQDIAVRLLHAEGGIGKTRLAIEWVRRRRGRFDIVGFLRPNPDGPWLERLCGLGAPVIIIVDYAERRADLVTVLQRIADFAETSGRRRCRIRVLLLARNDGDWWEGLQRLSSSIRALGHEESFKLEPLAMDASERLTIFVEASREFAKRRHQPPMLSPPPNVDDVRFERVLYLHMAALAAVERAPKGRVPEVARARDRVPLNGTSLMDEILDHEEHFWIREASDQRGVAVELPLARQIVAAATLRGQLATHEEVLELCRRLDAQSGTRATALVTLLHAIYDGGDRGSYLPGLEPDLLGEGMVLRIATPPRGAGAPVGDAWINRVFTAGDDTEALTTAFTVLGRISANNPRAVNQWLERLLESDLAVRAVLALRAGKAIGQRTASSALGDVLAEALEQNGSASIAVELAQEKIPYPTVSLGRVAVWRNRMQLKQVMPGDEQQALESRGFLLVEQGSLLRDLGQREAALDAAREAVDIYRKLTIGDAQLFQPHLAKSLNNLSLMQAALGQRESALSAAREAAELYRIVATHNADAFQPELALCLNNLGNRLTEMGLRDPALAAAREALEIYRMLAVRSPDAFLPGFAWALNELGRKLSAVGQREAALTVVEDAVGQYRVLAMRNPDAFLPDLAMSLDNLGATLSALGRLEAALVATREATEFYHTLALRNPDAFQHHYAMTLGNLGGDLASLGQHEAAMAATREATDLYRVLATPRPEMFQPTLAAVLINLSTMSSELGQHDTALTVASEAVDLLRALSTRNPDAFQFDLARSLVNLGTMLSELGQHERALAATRDAVDLLRSLAMHNPDAFQPDLAVSLSGLGAILRALNEYQPALAAIHEAVELRRMLAARHPAAFQPDLASSLGSLGTTLSELGQNEAALAATREAVDILRPLAAHCPDAFQGALASSLNNLGVRLSKLGEHQAALAATQEAVDLRRALAARTPNAFRRGLAESLSNMSVWLSELGQREAALAASTEAAEIFDSLATARPARYDDQDIGKSI